MGTVVHVNAAGQLGTAPSSQRFKDQIEPMDKASEAILVLKPVTFRYKREIDPERSPHFGPIAEEVDKVCPDLVGRDAKGEIDTVRYKAVNAMLLNEFLKEHKRVQQQAGKIEEQDRKLEQQEATITQLKKGMEVLTASLKSREHKSGKWPTSLSSEQTRAASSPRQSVRLQRCRGACPHAQIFEFCGWGQPPLHILQSGVIVSTPCGRFRPS